MADWMIRRADSGDASALAGCIESAYATHRSRVANLPAVADGIPHDIAHNLVWVAERDGKIVGGLVLVLKADHAILANVAVDPAATGTGLGRALIERAETESLGLGRSTLRLSTHVDLPENVSLYRHLGWREVARAGNKVHMEKTLGRAGCHG